MNANIINILVVFKSIRVGYWWQKREEAELNFGNLNIKSGK